MASLKEETLLGALSRIERVPESYPVFIETGTFMGETSLNMSKVFAEVVTIEALQSLYDKAKEMFRDTNVISLYGDSSIVLREVLEKLKTSAVFWLDGHYSGPDTFRGNKEFPIIEECVAIDTLFQGEESLVLIDDMRLLDNMEGLRKENLITCFKNKTVVDCWYIGSDLSDKDILAIYLK